MWIPTFSKFSEQKLSRPTPHRCHSPCSVIHLSVTSFDSTLLAVKTWPNITTRIPLHRHRTRSPFLTRPPRCGCYANCSVDTPTDILAEHPTNPDRKKPVGQRSNISRRRTMPVNYRRRWGMHSRAHCSWQTIPRLPVQGWGHYQTSHAPSTTPPSHSPHQPQASISRPQHVAIGEPPSARDTAATPEIISAHLHQPLTTRPFQPSCNAAA